MLKVLHTRFMHLLWFGVTGTEHQLLSALLVNLIGLLVNNTIHRIWCDVVYPIRSGNK